MDDFIKNRIFLEFVISQNATIYDAMIVINNNYKEIAFVVDDKNVLLGTITDGDIRRGLLNGLTLNSGIKEITNYNYKWVTANSSRNSVIDLMKAYDIRQIPVLDEEQHLIGIHFFQDFIGRNEKPNIAFILAGGQGLRLRPLTEKIPKPMMQVAGRPILERLILHLVGFGIREIFLSVNYLADVIENYFGDGSSFGCSIKYIKENQPLGTGGSLSLLQDKNEAPVLVLNGDLVTQFDVQKLLDFHAEGVYIATICAKLYSFNIPFGVIKEENNQLIEIEEKPTQTHFVNSGIYLINPEIIATIPKDIYYPITSLFDNLVEKKKKVGVFILEDEWIDIGRHDELNKANGL